MTIGHLISKYLIKHCVLLSARSVQLSVVSDVGLLCILLGDILPVRRCERIKSCSCNKLYNRKTISSHRIYKHIKSFPSYFTVLCSLYFSFATNRVINGTNVTMSDEHMWLIPFTEGQEHLLTIDLGHTVPLVGIRVWNYNKSTDDSFRGVSEI